MQGGSEQQDEQQHKIIPLDGGLDLVTPRLLTEPGRLVDCLNYECVDQVGYKKIDGFERYDGGVTPSAVGGYFFILDSNIYVDAAALAAIGIAPGLDVRLDFGGINSTATVYATVTSYEAATITGGQSTGDAYWKIYVETTTPEAMDEGIEAITVGNPDVIGYDSGYTVLWSIEKINNMAYVQSAATLAVGVTKADAERANVDALPNNVFPYGLQMYKDRMHAIADCQYIYVVYDHTVSVPVTADAQFFVGNVFRNGASGRLGVILDYKFLYGDFGALCPGGTYATSAVVKVLVRFLDNAALTDNTVLNIDRTTSAFTAGLVTCWKYQTDLTGTGVTTDDEPVWGGVLYKGLQEPGTRTSNNDWTQVSMGYEIGFKNGSSTIVPRELTLATTTAQLNQEIQTLVGSPAADSTAFSQAGMFAYRNSVTTTPMPNAGWETPDGGGPLTTGAPGFFAYDLTAQNATGVYLSKQSGFGWGDGLEVSFAQLGLEVPDDVIITGITVTSRNFYNSLAVVNDLYFHTVKLRTADGQESGNFANPADVMTQAANGTSANSKPYTYGGANQKWGLNDLAPSVVNDPAFKIIMTPARTTLAATEWLFWDTLTITVHYFRPVGKLFFNNGTSTMEGVLVRMHLDKGTWADGTAEGVAHIYGLATNGSRNYVSAGENMRLTAAGSDIADVTFVRTSFLPSHTGIVGSDRRVQMITANYFLNPDWECIYGCHGLGRAFSYDGTYFRKIYSAYDSELDKPRHLASYRNYLALGYESGNVLLSKVGESGPEPENFQPLQGAREFSFVDRITGLTELADTSLGVFCSQSINRIVLNPNASGASGLFYTSVISPNSGAIEYTVSTFGNMTLLCDQYGVRSVEQTDVFGDFIGRPVSFPVSPWLRPRLSAKKYWLDSKTAQRPLFAHTIRAKNQYRVWFDDGYVLCMNMNTTEEAPRFTFLRYGFNFGGQFVPMTPVAFTRATDKSGTERLHFSHWDRQGTSSTLGNSPSLFKYVFELERGWSFDGQDFPARLTLNLSFLETPFDYDQIRKVELHALDYNNTTLFAAFGTKYGEEKSYSGMAFSSTYVPAGRNTAGSIPTDYIPFSKMINVGNRGRPLYLKFKNATTATGDTSASAIEPPHILQALLVQYTPARQET